MTGLSGLLNLVYPAVCGICDKKLTSGREEALSLCTGCLERIKRNPAPYCRHCGRSLRGLVESVESCWECFGKKFYYERSWACLLYEGITKEALHLLKYSKKLSLSSLFCCLLTEFIKENPEILEGLDAVIAVPLHSIKLREREFNQAGLLAASIVKAFAIKDLSRFLKRTVATRPQSELDKNQRIENMKGTIEVVDPLLVRGKNLLLVDDLFTTGATLNECARVLKKAGAGKIHCLTFARGA